jgi:translocation and assembly module TamB
VEARSITVVQGQTRVTGGLDVGLNNWRLEPGSPLAGSLSLRAQSVAPLLVELGAKLPVDGGAITAQVKVGGTYGAPQASGEVQVLKLTAWGQPLDSIRSQVRYTTSRIEVSSAEIRTGSSSAEISGVYQSRQGNWREGLVSFKVASNGVQLAQVRAVREKMPGVGGRLETQMTGAMTVTPSGVRPGMFNGWVKVDDIAAERERLGSLALNVSGQAKTLHAQLQGELAGSKVSGSARVALEGEYPAHGQVEFAALEFSRVLAHLGNQAGRKLPFEGSVTGKIDFSGSTADPKSWKAVAELPVFEIRPPAGTFEDANVADLTLRNVGPILLDVSPSGVRVRQAAFQAKDTDLSMTGGFSFGRKNPWDVRVKGGVNLALLKELDSSIVASAGSVVLDVSVRGTLKQPDVYGRVDLKDASLNFSGFPNGIDKANGIIFLYRDRATIESLTAESGGGKVMLTGFVGIEGGTTFHLRAKASDVRVRYPEGVSSSMDADLSFTGTVDRSLLAGNVTVTRVGFNPRSDLGSILARTAQPVRVVAKAGRFERGVHFDVHIVTSPQARLETMLTRDVQADADLRLRGDMLRPVLLGRILINQGEVMFFGNQYTIDSGQILFVNSAKIEPVVSIDLETHARGIDVTLHVSGPIDKMNVSYRSDPPLSFPDIVALLTTGREPSSLASTAGAQTQLNQSWEQAGASALLSQAIASPVAGRLQRFFGVSRLKIDPQITGVTTNTATARVTLEQQISSNLTFTYITDVSRAQAQSFRVEWDFTRDWSAVAQREENGLFGIDFLYKKQFK